MGISRKMSWQETKGVKRRGHHTVVCDSGNESEGGEEAGRGVLREGCE